MMKTKRQNTANNDEDRLLKRQKSVQRCSPSPQLNALVPIATYGNDDDHESARNRATDRIDCPFLYTINRQVLDFDSEKFCSVSLSNINIYACMVCGKYFQGRGHKSHAYNHSLEALHHVYINLQTQKIYCLPDGYEIRDPSLEDIRQFLNPRFNKDQVMQLDTSRQWSRALDGSYYLPGMVGLNNIEETHFVNVTIQSLMRVTPLRNFFLTPENYRDSKSLLVHRFGELTRKIWNPRNFKQKVCPREFLEAVKKGSSIERFESDPVEFMSWLLNTLHNDLKTTKNSSSSSSVIHQCFQGELEVAQDGAETSRMPFLMLGLDMPLLTIINPQDSVSDILMKFDGETLTEVVRPDGVAKMRYRFTRLPQYLIFHMRRYTVEKNQTLVTFPLKNLELKDGERVPSKYDLVANIVLDDKNRVFVRRKSDELWYEMQDLLVKEALAHTVASSKAYMHIYEQQQQV